MRKNVPIYSFYKTNTLFALQVAVQTSLTEAYTKSERTFITCFSHEGYLPPRPFLLFVRHFQVTHASRNIAFIYYNNTVHLTVYM